MQIHVVFLYALQVMRHNLAVMRKEAPAGWKLEDLPTTTEGYHIGNIADFAIKEAEEQVSGEVECRPARSHASDTQSDVAYVAIEEDKQVCRPGTGSPRHFADNNRKRAGLTSRRSFGSLPSPRRTKHRKRRRDLAIAAAGAAAGATVGAAVGSEKTKKKFAAVGAAVGAVGAVGAAAAAGSRKARRGSLGANATQFDGQSEIGAVGAAAAAGSRKARRGSQGATQFDGQSEIGAVGAGGASRGSQKRTEAYEKSGATVVNEVFECVAFVEVKQDKVVPFLENFVSLHETYFTELKKNNSQPKIENMLTAEIELIRSMLQLIKGQSSKEQELEPLLENILQMYSVINRIQRLCVV
jgi:hypothetical protein